MNSQMTPEDWTKVKAIVNAALERAESERQEFLEVACADSGHLRYEIDSLIAAFQKSDGLSRPPWMAGFGLGQESPRSIGPYRLVRELGVGGMGQVWLAEQTEPVQRQVALKLIRAGMYGPQVAQRFFAERQSLALMNHPAIAKIFDAGTTPAGQPYLVMEYVDGCPITEYCDRRKLGIVDRLKLFQLVCDGVQHAHQKAIIHRDLKPSNILVTEVNGGPTPQIIDFGVAKGTAEAVVSTTQVGTIIGTLDYMSPEQAASGGGDIDTRSDVYSLGVILYELLVGVLPFDLESLNSLKTLEYLRKSPIQRPSLRLRELEKQAELAARLRATEADTLIRRLRGDLDAITLKALEIDRTRRYATPSALAGDIGNHLLNEPVLAQTPSVGYRAAKYILRHRVGVGMAVVAFLVLISFMVAQAVQVRSIRQARDRADRITGFMTNMFAVSDPSEARGNSVTAREILDRSSQEIEAGLAKDPELQAQMMNVMGNVYERLGLYSRAHELLQRSVDARKKLLGPRHSDTLQSMEGLAWLMSQEGQLVEAEKLQRQVLESRRARLRPDAQDVARAEDRLATTLSEQGKYREAEGLDREALTLANRVLGEAHPVTLGIMINLGGTLLQEGRFVPAETILREAVELARRNLGVEHSTTLSGMSVLGAVFISEGNYAEAEKWQQETVEVQRRVLGPDHPDTAGSIYNLAILAIRQGEIERAINFLREAVGHGLPAAAASQIKDDSDLHDLFGDPRFQALLVEVDKRLKAGSRPTPASSDAK